MLFHQGQHLLKPQVGLVLFLLQQQQAVVAEHRAHQGVGGKLLAGQQLINRRPSGVGVALF